MKIIRDVDIRRASAESCVLAVGNFDGVHLGHQQVFDTAVEQARALGVEAALLTFSDHPLKTLDQQLAPQPLMVLDDRLKIAGKWGFERAYVLDFDDNLASMTPELFTDRILIKALGASGIVAGSGWRFGKGRRGDLAFLKTAARGEGFSVWEVRPVMAGGIPVSSTRIRDLLARGDAVAARDLLGRPHFVRGVVRKGRNRGREIGFPTVNLKVGDVMVPADGVYAGAYIVRDKSGPAAVNVGPSPTFKDSTPGVEAHLLHWDGDLYGHSVIIVFLDRLRDERAYPDTATLADQIEIDVGRTEDLFTPAAIEGIEL